ncbi:hypothetical protein JCM11491_005391 [Sporobolomyces phaffii]
MSDPSKKRGRKLNDELPPSRSRDVQRAFRARRAAHLANLENRNSWLEQEVEGLKAKLGLLPGQYLTGPPPAEIEPDYDGVSEPSRVRGPNKRTTKGATKKDKAGAEQGSSKDLAWINQLGGSFNYGVYFVPKGSEQASFVGTTHFPSPPSSSNTIPSAFPGNQAQSPYPTPAQISGTSRSSFSRADSLRLLTSPEASSSTSTVSTAGPGTPPDGWINLREPVAAAKNDSEVYRAFCRLMSRAFGKGQVEDNHEADFTDLGRSMSRSSSGGPSDSPTDPLPMIRLPRFASGLPGSASSAAPSTDDYLHVSKVFEHFSPYLLRSTSPSAPPDPRLSPAQLVGMLQAQEQRSLLSTQPESFDFARPPTCLFLPPFSTPSCQPLLSRKETYVLAQAVEHVQRELERRRVGGHYA